MMVCTWYLPRLHEIEIINHMPYSHETLYEVHAIEVVYNAVDFCLS
jgi:hypothetical protein